jgi:hypothetical protein
MERGDGDLPCGGKVGTPGIPAKKTKNKGKKKGRTIERR